MHTFWDKKLLMLKPDEITVLKNRARKNFDDYSLRLLAVSIASNGIIEPLVIRKNRDGKYELVSGERRLRAAQLAGLRRVPCVLHKIDENKAFIYSVTENLQNGELHFFEQAEAFERLKNLGMKPSEIAMSLGLARASVEARLSLLRLDDNCRELIIRKDLSEYHSLAILSLPKGERYPALQKIALEGMSLRETEDFIFERLNPKPPKAVQECEEKPKSPCRKSAIGDARLFSNSLAKLVETLKSSGIQAHTRRYENDRFIEYRVKIKKDAPENTPCEQLKIC